MRWQGVTQGEEGITDDVNKKKVMIMFMHHWIKGNGRDGSTRKWMKLLEEDWLMSD